MAKKVRKIEQLVPLPPQKKRVAAYARVSSSKDAMLHSLSAQVSYYSNLIQNNPTWEFAGIYADEALTGTKDSRPEFQRLLADCRSGKVDMVITKSISRFARNTVTLLETTRELKALDIDVFFEEQNIHTNSGEGEMILTLLASVAQEESRAASENQKWRVRRNFEDGRPWNCTILGYKNNNGQLVIVPKEAAVIREIFSDYLSGKGVATIVNKLNHNGVATRFGGRWSASNIMYILRNKVYTGNLLLQKTYRDNHINKKKVLNNGVLPMYAVESSHEAIIDVETFNAVQAKIERRAVKYAPKRPKRKYPFSGKITCGCCGAPYRRKITAHDKPVWICTTFNQQGKRYCPGSKQIPEDTLLLLTAKVLGLQKFDETVFSNQIELITIPSPNEVTYRFKDGHEVTDTWVDCSRSESWTDEMRRAARERAIEHRRNA